MLRMAIDIGLAVPIILKGISTAEDAILAYEAGVQGIVLSNHGGRQLDTARSGLEVLVEVVPALRARGYFPDPNFEIFVDGGVRRASDVLKALALGAKAVGVGRPFLYAFCSYGQDGVEKAIQIFRVRCCVPEGNVAWPDHVIGRVRDEHALTRRAHDRRARAGDGGCERSVVTCRPHAAGHPLPKHL